MSRPLLESAGGEVLSLEDYYADFKENFAAAGEFWKLERGQEFAEPGNASWEAFNHGDWQEAMRLLEEQRADLIDYHSKAAARGLRAHRIRIVTLPLTPYLQWELNALKIRDETGGIIRVLKLEEISGLEEHGPLPEIYTMDDRVMYEAIYDENGVLENARRFTDTELVRRCRDFIIDLWQIGEPIGSFFRREVAHLPPAPSPGTAVRPDYLKVRGRPGPIRS
ncbi:hypothetical protein GCM10023085_09170 [Actinomadura viridis]|uniref:DUF6879 domain-containing protein n=1 Tax=Actinomadura viridis TaxID=58110 RepID=A0A931DNK4_9ACTN|nr:DUF6879 family protein [Actinomadura viridis]MBG6091929.1 hypothetical protein [Actinomadura viridis]